MTSAKSQEYTATRLGTLPTRKSAYTQQVLADPVKKAFQGALATSKSRPMIPGVCDLFVTYDQYYVKILRGQLSPKAGLDALAKDWQTKLLNDYAIGG